MLRRTLIAVGVVSALGIMPALANDPATKSNATTVNYADYGKAEAGKLIGHGVQDMTGNRIGEIEAIHIGSDGKISDVIVGVGGFLGVGERDVALTWKNFQITDNGDKIMVDTTKEKLKAMPAYKFSKATQRKTVFETPG
jgi:hypothetical protein